MLPDWTISIYTVIVAMFVCFLCGEFISRWRSTLPPGPMGYPLIGNVAVLSNRHNVPSLLTKYAEIYGKIFCLRFGVLFPPVVVLMGYKLNKEVFVTQSCASRGRMGAPDRGNCPGLMSSNGERWKCLRQYAAAGLRDVRRNPVVVERLEQEATVLVQEMKKMTSQTVCDPRELIVNAATNAVITVVTGIRYHYDDPEFAEFKGDNRAYQKVTQALTFSSVMSLLRFLPGVVSGPSIRLRIINKRREILRRRVRDTKLSSSDTKSDLIQVGLDMIRRHVNEYMTEENMVEVLLDTFVAGVMPIANLVAFVLVFMLHFPDVQKKCQEELDSEIDNKVKIENKEKLPYVTAVINEVVRLAGTPINIPHKLEDEVTVAGYRLPKGTLVIGHLSSIHTDPDHWTDPYRFNPNRWLDENGSIRTTKAFYPFSLGPRMCVGKSLGEMATFLFVSNLIRTFTFSIPEGHPIPPTTGLYDGMGGMKPAFLNMKLTERPPRDV